MRVASACFIAAVTLAGCGADRREEAESAADCTNQVRLGGVIYSGYGYSDRRAKEFATADEAECHDVGVDASSSVFPADPRQVSVWAFPGYSPDKLLGVPFDKDTFEVFIAESVPHREMDRILDKLSRSVR